MSPTLLVDNFDWIKGLSQFNENFIKNYKEKSDKECFFKVDVRLYKLLNNLSFLPETMKFEKVE